MSKSTEKVEAALASTLEPIIASIEDGIADPDNWVAPWHKVDADLFNPFCPATGRHYTAGNRFILAMTSMGFGAEPHWGTYNQWKGMSKHTRACNKTVKNAGKRNESRPDCDDDCHLVNVAKGEKAIAYALRPLMRKDENDAGEEVTRIFGFAPFVVFHSGQVDGYSIARDETAFTPVTDAEDVAAAFEFAAATGATVNADEVGNRAFYSPGSDSITVPAADRWKDAGGCWGTIAHELTHWTGHKSRLDRDLTGRFGDDAYAAEELVAELGSAFTLSKLGRSAEPRADHAEYLAHWLRVLKADPKHLMTVASAAEKASSFVLEAADTETLEVAA